MASTLPGLIELDKNALVRNIPAELIAANANWVRGMNQTFPQYFPDYKVGQAPKIIWLGCSDSRIQESDVLAALPGTSFVHRNIANQVHPIDDNALSVLSYALSALGVQHIVVAGHSHCGGVITALKNRIGPPLPDGAKHHFTLHDTHHDTVPEHHVHGVYDSQSQQPKDVITRWLSPLVDHLNKIELPVDKELELKAAIEENVKLQVHNFTTAPLDAFVRAAAKNKPVWVHGWVYDFGNGVIQDLKITKEIG